MKLQLLITLFLCNIFMETFSQNISAPEITQKEAFAYLLKIFNKNPDEKVCKGIISEYNRSNKYEYGFYVENTWTKIYAKSQYYYEYKQTFNDEFKFPELLEKSYKEINIAINDINFNKKFSVIITGKVEDYDFTNERFPVEFDVKSSCLFKEIINDYKTDCFIGINSYNAIDFMEKYTENNKQYYKPPYFNIKKEQASKFITERKDVKGYVNRNVYLKLEYSVSNTRIDKNYYQSFFGCPTNVIINVSKIEVWADKYCVTKKLGVINKINNTINNISDNIEPKSVINNNSSNSFGKITPEKYNSNAIINLKTLTENILYIGINNEISLETQNVNDIQNINLVDAFSQIKRDGTKFYINPTTQGNTSIKTIINTDKGIFTYSTNEYKLQLIPNPIITIKGYKEQIPLSELKTISSLDFVIENFPYNVKFDVSYEIQIKKPNSNEVTKFDKQMSPNLNIGVVKKYIQNYLEIGDEIIISDIVIEPIPINSGNFKRKLDNITFKVI